MIISQGAVDFAVEQGISLVEPDSLVTEYEKAALKKLQDYKPAVKNIFGDQNGHDTVGAVAVDDQGNFARIYKSKLEKFRPFTDNIIKVSIIPQQCRL